MLACAIAPGGLDLDASPAPGTELHSDQAPNAHRPSQAELLALLGAKEDALLELAKSEKAPEKLAGVYSRLASLFGGQMGRRRSVVGIMAAEKTATYCEKALDLPVAPTEGVRLCVLWADALVLRHEDPPPASRELAQPLLQGLKVVAENQTEAQEQALPLVAGYDFVGDPNSPELVALVRKHEAQLRMRNEVQEQNHLIYFRKLLVRKCAEIYAKLPNGVAQFKPDARAAGIPEKIQEEVREEIAKQIKEAPAFPSDQ
jgi:hypothetical protein